MWNCYVCTKFKLLKQKTQSWLYSLSISECCWCNVFMNYVGSLPPSIFMSIIYWYVLVFVNCFIKMRHLVPIILMKIEETTECFYVYVWKHHDLSESLVFNKNTQFTSDIWQHLYQILKIDAKLFTVYHFKINEQTERINTVIKHYLWAFINYMQNDWAKWLSDAEFSVNNAPFSITLASLFLANFRQNSCLKFKSPESLPVELTAQVRIKLLNIEKFTKKMKKFIKHL